MKILLVADIHGNYPALKAVADHFADVSFDLIINNGDTIVYGPFPNETIDWLRKTGTRSILGNTDRLVVGLLHGRSFVKPSKPDKRIMYGWTAAELSTTNRAWLAGLPEKTSVRCPGLNGTGGRNDHLGVFHGSPADPDEFLFATTPDRRFAQLAATVPYPLITIGHSHSPFHKFIDGVHFVNPGSTGRMFDGNPDAACATIDVEAGTIRVELHRIAYPVETVVAELRRLRLPQIYQQMYRQGRKLN
ncbi:MAG: metallophosphoesterase family protein [Desulfofustis sp.]|nr:metallophosphoesterase family protein [Desulfofustis sp.]